MDGWIGDHWAAAVGVLGIVLQLVGFGWTAWGLRPVWRDHGKGSRTDRWIQRVRRRSRLIAQFLLEPIAESQTVQLRTIAGSTLTGITVGPTLASISRPASPSSVEDELNALWENQDKLKRYLVARGGHQNRKLKELRRTVQSESADRQKNLNEIRTLFERQAQREIDVSSVAVILFILGTILTGIPIVWS